MNHDYNMVNMMMPLPPPPKQPGQSYGDDPFYDNVREVIRKQSQSLKFISHHQHSNANSSSNTSDSNPYSPNQQHSQYYPPNSFQPEQYMPYSPQQMNKHLSRSDNSLLEQRKYQNYHQHGYKQKSPHNSPPVQSNHQYDNAYTFNNAQQRQPVGPPQNNYQNMQNIHNMKQQKRRKPAPPPRKKQPKYQNIQNVQNMQRNLQRNHNPNSNFRNQHQHQHQCAKSPPPQKPMPLHRSNHQQMQYAKSPPPMNLHQNKWNNQHPHPPDNGYQLNPSNQIQWKRNKPNNGPNRYNQPRVMSQNQYNGHNSMQQNGHNHHNKNGYNKQQPPNVQQQKRPLPKQKVYPKRMHNVGSLQAAQPIKGPQKALNGRYQTFATFEQNLLGVWIKNLNDPSVVYKNDFSQSSFEKLNISYIAKTLIDYLLSKKPVTLSENSGDILLSVPMTDLPSFTLKRDGGNHVVRHALHYKMTM